MAKDDSMSRVRRKAQHEIEMVEAEHKRQLLRKRIELAQQGVIAYRNHKMTEAVRSFQTYLRILEDWKGVSAGGLTPANFDRKLDVAEMLLISGVYWDLLKLYDRTKSPERFRDFLHYMEKYRLFSKGMPYQPVCAETLRKYVSANKAVHKTEFKNLYKELASTKCFIATSLFDVTGPETLPQLWRFRDRRLAASVSGRILTAIYYGVAPTIACALERMPLRVRALLGRALDQMARRLDPG